MSIKKFLYWVIFFGLTIGGIIYGWPGETPTYRVPIWLPKGPSDPSLAAAWIQKPGEQLGQSFRYREFAASWSFVTPIERLLDKPEGEPQRLIHLGKDGMGTVFSTSQDIGGIEGIMPWPESWLRPISVDKADIDPAGFLVIRTRQDLFYLLKSGLMAMILSLLLIWFLYEKMGTASRFVVRWPLTHLPPPPAPADEEPREPSDGSAASAVSNPVPPKKTKRGKRTKGRFGGAGIA